MKNITKIGLMAVGVLAASTSVLASQNVISVVNQISHIPFTGYIKNISTSQKEIIQIFPGNTYSRGVTCISYATTKRQGDPDVCYTGDRNNNMTTEDFLETGVNYDAHLETSLMLNPPSITVTKIKCDITFSEKGISSKCNIGNLQVVDTSVSGKSEATLRGWTRS